MKKETIITIGWIVILIGVGCFGAGIGTVIGYLYGNYNLSRWYGEVPMAFSTACCICAIGVALYLIGKFVIEKPRLRNDTPIG